VIGVNVDIELLSLFPKKDARFSLRLTMEERDCEESTIPLRRWEPFIGIPKVGDCGLTNHGDSGLRGRRFCLRDRILQPGHTGGYGLVKTRVGISGLATGLSMS
jgi:hypothetical protein